MPRQIGPTRDEWAMPSTCEGHRTISLLSSRSLLDLAVQVHNKEFDSVGAGSRSKNPFCKCVDRCERLAIRTPILPYDCHEHNYGMRNILQGARAEDGVR